MNLDVEFAVVGATVTNPGCIPDVLTKIVPGDLYDPKAETVLSTVAGLWAEGTPVDALAVVQKLAGGQVTAPDVFAMVEQACVPTSLGYHLGVIADRAAVRRLGAAGSRISTLAGSGASPQSIAQQAQDLLDGAVRPDESQVLSMGEVAAAATAETYKAAAGETESGLSTGLSDLDDVLGGFHGGQMVVLAARPGLGKSTLAVDFMRHASMRMGVPSMMFSLEMGASELGHRILAAESGVNLSKITSGQMDDREWQAFEDTSRRVADVPLFVDDSATTTVTDIVAKSKLMVERKGVGLIVVDYLQLLRSDQRVESREQEVASYSRAMKLLAKQCDVPVVVVAQLNRESVKRGGKPAVSDLRESGALEQDADVIMLIDRPAAFDPDERAGEADIIVGKNRRGRTGEVTVASQLHYSRFRSMARSGV